LVHDTFHHHLAADVDYFPEYTGIVHISGVADPAPATDEMRDDHRRLVDELERVGNIAQTAGLIMPGYDGAISIEAFSPQVHAVTDPAGRLTQSLDHIRSAIR